MLRGPVPAVDVVFSRPVDPASFTVADLSLTRDGGPELLSAAVSMTQTGPATFHVAGLGTLTAAAGQYSLLVRASTVLDTTGEAGVGQLTDKFTIDPVGPVIASFDEIAPSPRNAPLSTLNLTFSKPILSSSFTGTALRLTLNGKPASLSSIHLIALDETHYRIAGLAPATGFAGAYQLTVSATGVRDALGNPGTGSVTRSWSVSLKAPAAPTRLAITPDRGISASDGLTNTLSLTVHGSVATGTVSVGVVDSSSNVNLGRVAVFGAKFALPVILPAAGSHSLSVVAFDAAGNFSPPATLRVFVDLGAPTATLTQVTPTPRTTPVSSIEIKFSEAVNPTTLTKAALLLTRDGTPVPIAAGVILQPATPGSYLINGLAKSTDLPGIYVLSLATIWPAMQDRARRP
jgi:hypothetical protein